MQQKTRLTMDAIHPRDLRIDRIKGIAIILMVYGHACPFCRSFIYQFHMAVFLMASGFCFKDTIRSGSEFRTYLLRRIRTLYLPYILLNGLVVLCMNGLIQLNIYTDDPRFLADTQQYLFPQVLTKPYNLSELLHQMKWVLLFHNTTQIGTATWFLTALFEISILHALLSMVSSRLKDRTGFYVGLLVVTTWLAWYLNVRSITFLYPERCLPGMYAPFLLGVLLRRIQWDGSSPGLVAVCAFLILCVLTRYQVVELGMGLIGNPCLYLLGSVAGWYLLEAIAHITKDSSRTGRFLAFLGQHTMGILCLHILAFKFVSLLYVRLYHRPDYLIASFHIIFDANEYWRVLYGVAGVLLPLLVILPVAAYRNRRILHGGSI